LSQTSGEYLLDTNIVIALLVKDAAVAGRVAAAPAVYVSATVLGELYFCARKSGRVVTNVQRVDDFARGISILTCDWVTAQHYGIIRNALRAAGRPIPENDTWIAATALQHDLILVTRDVHFQHVPNLSVESW
jgi:tRNA(fMet)-specific endonuclease VapC